MVKKRKANKGSGGKDGGQTGDDACDTSKVKTGAFCVKSSLGVPFLVVSDCNLVSGVPMPSNDEWKELLAISHNVVKQWDAKGGSVILADFEGEQTGLEGELISAAFQRTWAISPKGLKQMPCKGASRSMGLLVDLRSVAGAALAKRIMESDYSKIIWGADGDVASLHYSPVHSPLRIKSSQVIDAQLAFSSQKQRLSMSNMLKRLPVESLAGLPYKESIDFTTPHAFNRRALHTPLSLEEAKYAIDDLHRLDVVLINEKPASGSYLSAASQSSAMVSLILHNVAGSSTTKLQHYEGMLNRKLGLEKQSIAVRIKRHLIALRGHGMEACSKDFVALEDEVDKILKESGVCIPDDLSFSSDPSATKDVASADEKGEGTCSQMVRQQQQKKKRKKTKASKTKQGIADVTRVRNEVVEDSGAGVAEKKLGKRKRKHVSSGIESASERQVSKRRGSPVEASRHIE